MRNLCSLTIVLAVLTPGRPALARQAPINDPAANDPAANEPAANEPAANDAKAGASLEDEVRQLVKDLGSDTRAQRAGAERRLRELGPKVLPHLPPSELLPSVSVRESVRRIRLDLERIAARESVLPSRVTLRGRLPVGAALGEISRQTGNVLDGRELPQDFLMQPIDFDFDKSSFWESLDDLAARLKVRYRYDPLLRGLKLEPVEPGAEEAAAVGYSGAFRVQVLRAERVTGRGGRKSSKSATADDLLRVSLSVRPEPRLRALFLQVPAAEIKARAGDIDLKPFSPEANYELAVGEGGDGVQFQIDFVAPAGVATPTIALSGKLRCTTAAENRPLRFADIAKVQGRDANIARRRGGVTVVLNHVRIVAAGQQNEARIRITVSYDGGGPAFETHRTWILHNEVYLEDAAGRRVRLNGGSETSFQGDGTLVINYSFLELPDPLPEFAFVYVAPSLIVDVPIEFQIQSVPVETRK